MLTTEATASPLRGSPRLEGCSALHVVCDLTEFMQRACTGFEFCGFLLLIQLLGLDASNLTSAHMSLLHALRYLLLQSSVLPHTTRCLLVPSCTHK